MSFIETTKDIISVLQKADNIDLIQKMVGIQEEYLKFFEENTELKQQLKDLTEKLILKGKMEFDGTVYKLDGRGYYCPKCYEDEGKPINLTFHTDYNNGYCPKCENHFYHILGRPSAPQQFHAQKIGWR